MSPLSYGSSAPLTKYLNSTLFKLSSSPTAFPPTSKMRLSVLSFLWFLPCCVLATVFDLSSLHWTLTNQNGSISVPGSVPSQVHLDLVRTGIITEPLLGINDFTERWVWMDNWTYTADLTPAFSELKNSDQVLLVFHGLDTIANITLAGKPVAWVNNQFRQYVFDVSWLRNEKSPGNLTVAFESAYFYGRNVSRRADFDPWLPGDVYVVPANRTYIRKINSDFGWDWGPAFVPSGIFKPAYLISLFNTAKANCAAQHVFLEETAIDNSGAQHILLEETAMDNFAVQHVYLEETAIDIYKVGQNFSVPPNEKADWVANLNLASRFAVKPITPTTDSPAWVTVLWHIPDSIPKRWYPHNLGTPQLYDLIISLSLDAHNNKIAPVVRTVRTGFRTIKLAQLPYSRHDVETRGITPGDQWHFEINGKAFYSLGTNIIPFDPFYARTTTEQVRWVLESAKRSGQNMVRAWGGGMYQPDSEEEGVYDFYGLCDELGILVWSEFIFSDAIYPTNDWYLESIEPEIRQNVRRVNKHPSLAQWAGSNEVELYALDYTSGYVDQFVMLFQDFLQPIAVSETHSVPYTDCSTTTGVLSLEPYVLRLRNATAGNIYGNSEKYVNFEDAFNYESFPVSRLVNEFGFLSMPSFYSWEEVLTSPEDFFLQLHRSHAAIGQSEMTSAVALWLPPLSTLDSNQTFAQMCWSTQIFQAMAMMSQISWYRRGAGKGENNLGALVWQLNDIWQGVSWSSIEYSGRWKVLNYGITTTFSPIVIYPFWTAKNESLEVIVMSDRWQSVKGTAQLTWYDWHGKALTTRKDSFTVPALNNTLPILSQVGLRSILPSGHNATDVWMLLNLTAQVEGKTVTNEQYFTPASLANATLVDPRIHVTSTRDLMFTLSAKGGVAPWTWLDHPAGTVGVFVHAESGLPSNGFYLVPGIDRTVKFILNEGLSKNTRPDPAQFVVRSLWNNNHPA
ncbi:glycoside hydrolase family 2 protein [Mycena leptocephala]|nr:glycoside hydrolase family 2 protein [Mycena leptocephala]